jgi:prephenate dehydrogenase
MPVLLRPSAAPTRWALHRVPRLAYLSADMSPHDQERIGIIGLGAVGGSLALAWRDQHELRAWSHDATDRAAARAAGIEVCGDDSTWPAEMANATAVVLAVPLRDVASVVRQILARLPDDSLVLHTTSLQSRDALGLSEDEFRRVLGTHPIAGSERSGFAATNVGMFRGATLRAEARAADAERRRIERLWRAAGISRIAWTDAAVHDALMSWVSHLPQLTATALAAVLAAQGIAQRDMGPGARDMTRLASSDPGMWAPILRNAPRETLDALRRLTSTLDALRTALERQDDASIATSWEQARAWRQSGETSA